MTLTKTGPGTQILAATNTYTGATFINAGTLALGANDVLPSTAVSIGDATLDVANFTDTVGTLDLTGPATIHLDADGNIAFANSSAIDWTNDIVGGGTLNITGTFVSGSSLRFGNTNAGLTPQQLALITAEGFGPVTLNAAGYLTASAISSYATWAVTNAPITGSNPNADEDGDGVPNGVEYVLGGTIGTNDQANLPALSTSGGNLVFTFQRDQASIDGTTILMIEVGTDLATWTIPPSPYAVPIAATGPVNPGVSVVKDSPEPGIDTVTLTLPQTPDSKKFVRLRVTP
jgi:autotransporter-associated beta strand protein